MVGGQRIRSLFVQHKPDKLCKIKVYKKTNGHKITCIQFKHLRALATSRVMKASGGVGSFKHLMHISSQLCS